MFGQVISRVGKITDFGLEYGRGFGKWDVHPHPTFQRLPPQWMWLQDTWAEIFYAVEYNEMQFTSCMACASHTSLTS